MQVTDSTQHATPNMASTLEALIVTLLLANCAMLCVVIDILRFSIPERSERSGALPYDERAQVADKSTWNGGDESDY